MKNKETVKYKPIYKHLTIKEGEAFFEKNKDKLEIDVYMDYTEYYNIKMMNCRDVADKNRGKRIVLRRCCFNDYYELNILYENWQ